MTDAVANSQQAVQVFQWPVRIYYEDTDAGGVVYYANYLRYLERARTEWLRALGFGQQTLMAESGILFAVRHVEIDYLQPARFDDELVVEAHIEKLSKVSLTFAQRIVRAPDAVLVTARVKVACLDSASFRPKAIPEAIRNKVVAG